MWKESERSLWTILWSQLMVMWCQQEADSCVSLGFAFGTSKTWIWNNVNLAWTVLCHIFSYLLSFPSFSSATCPMTVASFLHWIDQWKRFNPYLFHKYLHWPWEVCIQTLCPILMFWRAYARNREWKLVLALGKHVLKLNRMVHSSRPEAVVIKLTFDLFCMIVYDALSSKICVFHQAATMLIWEYKFRHPCNNLISVMETLPSVLWERLSWSWTIIVIIIIIICNWTVYI